MKIPAISRLHGRLSEPPQITEGKILPSLVIFALPIMFGTLLQQLYSTIDTLILGRFVGKAAIAAVGGSDAVLIYLLVDFFVGLSSGAAIIVSQFCGAEDRNGVVRSIRTGMVFAVVIGLLTTVIGIIVAPMCLAALDTPQETMAYSVDYLVWYFAGMIPAMIYNMGSSILRATGDSRRPLIFLAISCGTNVLLDLLFIAVFRMEVKGAAIATSLSQLVSAALVTAALMRTHLDGFGRLRDWIPDFRLIRNMLLIGLPTGLQSSLYNITNMFVTKAVNRLSTDAIAAYAIHNKFDAFFWPVGNAFAIAVMTFVGQNYGARKPDRIRRCVRCGAALYASCGIVASAFFLLFGERLATLFSSDPDVISITGQLIRGISWGYACFTFASIIPSAMRGTGNAVVPAIVTLFGACIFRLAILFFYTFPNLSVASICACYPPTWLLTSILFLVYYRFFPWMPKYPDEEAVSSGA